MDTENSSLNPIDVVEDVIYQKNWNLPGSLKLLLLNLKFNLFFLIFKAFSLLSYLRDKNNKKKLIILEKN